MYENSIDLGKMLFKTREMFHFINVELLHSGMASTKHLLEEKTSSYNPCFISAFPIWHITV